MYTKNANEICLEPCELIYSLQLAFKEDTWIIKTKLPTGTYSYLPLFQTRKYYFVAFQT